MNYQIPDHISVIWIWEKFENPDTPPRLKVVYILNCGLFDFQRWPSVLAIETIEKANSCEPFIEVDDTLNKLKNGDVI